MKRKRKNKRGRPKGSVAVAAGGSEAVSSGGDIVNLENEMNVDEDGNDDNKYESGMEVDTPSSTGTDQHLNLASINPDGSIDRGVGKSVGRVKVKLRKSKTLESQPTSSDAYTLSDTDKSSQQIGLERQGMVYEKMEDSANSLPEGASGNASSKKAGSIKIKSSNVLGSSVNLSADPGPARSESPPRRQPNMSGQDSRYDKQELDTALMIIKKVMKMDAAEPFNVPVNPEALGIPDYFDVIDTPMDFGTICSNLEQGVKYTNSKDVFNDVEYIWNNCYKYNNKGDYILELMKRVKKNFSKYWTAAGLYSGQPTGTNGAESTPEIVAPSDQGKFDVKGGQLKQKARKGHGRRHKSDCLCAICVLKRRRREREENARIANSQHGASDNSLAQDFKQEESSLAESPGENSSSEMDGSMDPDADAEMEEKGEEVKMAVSKQQYGPSGDKHDEEDDDNEGDEEEDSDAEMKDEGNGEALEQLEKSREEPNRQLQPIQADKIAAGVQTDRFKENALVQNEEENVADKQPKSQESQERRKKVRAYENLQFENPMLLDLCGVLFPNNSKSIWSGPHSMVQHRSSRTSSIHAAISMLMK